MRWLSIVVVGVLSPVGSAFAGPPRDRFDVSPEVTAKYKHLEETARVPIHPSFLEPEVEGGRAVVEGTIQAVGDDRVLLAVELTPAIVAQLSAARAKRITKIEMAAPNTLLGTTLFVGYRLSGGVPDLSQRIGQKIHLELRSMPGKGLVVISARAP